MKAIVSACLLVVIASALARPDGATYTDKHDNINLDEIKNNDRIIHNYVECLMDRGACPPEAKTLKENLPDALETKCSKCTPKQKEGAEDMINFLIHKKPEIWQELQTKYDPTGEYTEKYKAEYEKVKNKKQ